MIERREVPYPQNLTSIDYKEKVDIQIFNEKVHSENNDLFVCVD